MGTQKARQSGLVRSGSVCAALCRMFERGLRNRVESPKLKAGKGPVREGANWCARGEARSPRVGLGRLVPEKALGEMSKSERLMSNQCSKPE
jgi:hypothetical protein